MNKISMTKKQIMIKAHQLTKAMKAEFPQIHYHAQLGLTIKFICESINAHNAMVEATTEDKKIAQIEAPKDKTIAAKVDEVTEKVEEKTEKVEEVPEKVKTKIEKVEEKEEVDMNNPIILGRKEVVVNNIPRTVAIKIDGDLMLGAINNKRFIWRFKEFNTPTVEGVTPNDMKKASAYAKLFILKRLEMDNIDLPIKTNERKVDYIHIPLEDGVWCNCFVNGYIRGEIDGNPFAWESRKYKDAVLTTEAGPKGYIETKIDPRKIIQRLKKSGIYGTNDVVDMLRMQA